MATPEHAPDRNIDTLSRIAAGSHTLRDLLGQEIIDTAAVAYLGRAAFDGKRYDDACAIFSTLATIEPDNPNHAFCLAEVEVKRGNVDAAVAWLDQYLHHHGVSSPIHRVNALRLRASLTQESRPEEAAADIALARRIGALEPAAGAIIETILP